jgi:hypothetical protein
MWSLVNQEKIKISMSAYMAVTSNTAQVGASVSLFAQVTDNITAEGFLGFDALFQFSPFYFTFESSAMLAIKRKSKNILSISLYAKVQGPNPWSVYGTAEIEVVGVKVQVNINHSWGTANNTTLPNIQVLPLVKRALEDKYNWNVDLPDHKNQMVTFRDIESEDLVAHPSSVLSVKQKVVPFNMNITTFGNQRPSDFTRFSISEIFIGSKKVVATDITEDFALAQFLSLSESQKVARNSFEKMPAGVKFQGTDAVEYSKVVHKTVEYETIIVDKPDEIRIKYYGTPLAESLDDFNLFIAGSDTSTSPLSKLSKKPSTFIKTNEEKYVISNINDLDMVTTDTFDSMNEAYEAMQAIINLDPWKENELQVLAEYELV